MPDLIITVQDFPTTVNIAQGGIQGPQGIPGPVSSFSGVLTLNSLLQNVNLTGLGNNSIIISGQTIQISGATGFLTGYATIGNLFLTGQNNYNLITGFSGQLNLQTGYGHILIDSPKINFAITGNYQLYTVPQGALFVVNSVEVITTDSIGFAGGTGAYLEFGTNKNQSGIMSLFQTTSTGLLSRDYRINPSDAISGGNIITSTVYSGTLGISHSGYTVIQGYLKRA